MSYNFRPQALLLEGIHPSAEKIFCDNGFLVESVPYALSPSELADRLDEVTFLGIRSGTTIDANALVYADKLRGIGAFCVGTNQIDLDLCKQKGIAVINAPLGNTRSVIEMVIGLIITLSRRLLEKDKEMQRGLWQKSAAGSHEVSGKSLGIVGYGNIGSQLSVLAEALGMHVYFYDMIERVPLGNAQRCNTLDELLAVSDVITLHTDGRTANTHLIGESEFAKMKDDVIFINMSRGSLVDADALAKNLKSKKIAGAAVDVFPDEPAEYTDTFKSALQGLPNVILTPHVGGSTEEAQARIGEFVATKFVESFVRD